MALSLSKDEMSKRGSQIKGKQIHELVSIDNDMINNALLLIDSPELESVELKKLLLQLVKTIKEMGEIINDLYMYKEAQLISNIYSTNEKVVYQRRDDFEDLVKEVQDHLSKASSDIFVGSMFDVNKKDTIKGEINKYIITKGIQVDGYDNISDVVDAVQKEILGLSVLEKYMDNGSDGDFDNFVEEIRINEFTDIRIVKGGREERTTDKFKSPEQLEKLAIRIVSNSAQEQRFSVEDPFVRIRIGDTTRVSIMRDPIARRDSRFTSGPVIHMRIRKQRLEPFSTDFLLKKGSVDEYTDKLLKLFFKNKISIVFYGGTGTGKTGTMTAYIHEIPDSNAVITIAEIDEMNAAKIDLREKVEYKGREIDNPNFGRSQNSVLMWELPDQSKEIVKGRRGFSGLVNAALTMTPDTIIMQESKGNEILALLEAAMSDHQVLTTLHASDIDSFFIRLHHMAQGESTMDPSLLAKQFPLAFPVIVKISRYVDGSRKVSEIAEIQEYISITDEYRTNTLIQFKVDKTLVENGKKKVIGKHRRYGLPSNRLQDKLLNNGMLSSDWQDLTVEFNKGERSIKPDYVDRLYYDEYIMKQSV